MTNEPVTYLGAKLRELAAEHGSGVTQLGTLFVRVTRHGNDWACELNDDKEITAETVDEWADAVGAPESANLMPAYGFKVWRVEWTGTEDAAPEGAKAFYLGGAK